MFYENFKRLCSERGTTPTAVAKAMGISTSMTANWKKGGVPRADTLQKVADHFGVSTSYLLGNAHLDLQHFAEKEKEPTVEVDPKLLALIGDMSADELEELERYAEFILSKKKEG
jgi:transcriptional regulator with XRE-family HTH domain